MRKVLCNVLIVCFFPAIVFAGQLIIYNDCSRCSSVNVTLTFPASIDGPAYQETQTIDAYGLSVAFETTRSGTYRVLATCTGDDQSWDLAMDLSGGLFEKKDQHLECRSLGICPAEKVYGEESDQAEFLRYFRDSVLSKTQEGQEIIELYYLWSPVIVKAMETDDELKQEIKDIVDEMLPMLRREVE